MKRIDADALKELLTSTFLDAEMAGDVEKAERLLEYFKQKKEWSALDILRLSDSDVNDSDKLHAVLRPELIDRKLLHELACDFAEHAQIYVNAPHADSLKAIEVKRKWLRGEATDWELRIARTYADTAEAAAADDAAAAWAAADAAADARTAAADACTASAAARAAEAAAYAAVATDDAADDAAWAAGCAADDAAAERKWQINHVIEVLDGLEEEAEQ